MKHQILRILCITLAITTASISAQDVHPRMLPSDKIYVAGHRGLVGSALVRALTKQGFTNIITRSSQELNLCNQAATEAFFAQERPDFVFLAAARVGGIHANNVYRAQAIYDNLMISANVIHAAYKYGTKKLLFLGSSCIYPRMCPQPIKEEYLLTSALEKTNEPYALAKIAGLNLVESYNRQYGTHFISCMPTNLYGPHDNFDLETSHVLPALIRKMYDAKKNNTPHVTLWGSGMPRREFLYADDLAEGCIFLMQNYNENVHINIGAGKDIAIKDLAEMIRQEIGYEGTIVWDSAMPDGTPQKLLDVSKINALGWHAKTALNAGIKKAAAWFLAHEAARQDPLTPLAINHK